MGNCSKEIIKGLLNIMDPLGVIEVCPDDEYSNEVCTIYNLLIQKKYDKIMQLLNTLYGKESDIEHKKIKEFIKLLQLLDNE